MIQSEEFPPYDLQKEFWTLRLYPKGYQHLSKEGINIDNDSTIQFYLTLCSSQLTSNGINSNNPNHIASSLMNTSSRQLQIYFRALIHFSNSQVNLF